MSMVLPWPYCIFWLNYFLFYSKNEKKGIFEIDLDDFLSFFNSPALSLEFSFYPLPVRKLGETTASLNFLR